MKLVYIVSMGHSGSTLLDLLLSSHSRVTSVGEVKRLGRDEDPNCSCPARKVWQCPFWSAVERHFTEATGWPLRDARLDAADDQEFVHRNRALLEAVRTVTGKSVIVDSSKLTQRLQRLLETRAVDVLPVHLLRRPEGVVFSNIRKGRGWFRASWGHGRRTRRTEQLLRGHPALFVRYEDLVARPREVLEDILSQLDLVFEDDQLSFAGRERHNCGGNRMRWSTDDRIRLDEAWRRGLPQWQQVTVRLLASAGRTAPLPTRAPAV